MKILCLHGYAPLLYELRKSYDFQTTFVTGPTPAPAAFGIAGQYEGPFYRWFDAETSSPAQLVSNATHNRHRSDTSRSPEDYIRVNMRQRGLTNVDPTNACDHIESIMQTHDAAPFDAILGFSEGAAAAAGWLYRQAAQNSIVPIKFALFFSGTPPAHFEQKDVLLADETSERITIPTAHFIGSQDPAYESGLALYNLCEKALARIYDHGKGHNVPWDLKITQAMAKEILDGTGDEGQAVADMVSNGHFSNGDVLANGRQHSVREYQPTQVSPSPWLPTKRPIAVIGIAGRFPGDATSPRALWEMCCEGRSAWSEVPESRMNAKAYFHPNASKTGCFNTRGAHYLQEDVAMFDAPFFHITPNEAKAMDPQQRLLLECSFEALENSGATLQSIKGSSTGVYVGAAQIDYTLQLHKDVEDIPIYQATGTSANVLSNRISYVFDLKGPSITMDTACSSSLAALHTACQSLQAGDISQAIVGGAHIMLSPDTMVGMSMLKLFGEQGKSFTYDSRGTGYGRGEGVVSLVLKPLDDAVRDGDSIRAVIRNTGINQDGKTNGITFPSCDAQAQLIEDVYKAVGLDPGQTPYVEAHGTGTAAGDPVEAEAIARTFAINRAHDNPLLVGSVKTNVGHLEAASGLTGLVKTIYALEQGVIPPNINFEYPNKDIPLEEWKLKVPTTIHHWPADYPRRASISNFGFGGTNVHVIVEGYNPDSSPNHSNGVNGHASDLPSETPKANGYEKADASSAMRRKLLVLSAHDKTSLQQQMRDISKYISERSALSATELMDSLVYTLCQRRSTLDWREAVSASSPAELSEILSNELNKDRESSLVDRPYISQPATTAIQIALVDLLSSWKIKPCAVVGHSSGEIAAAYATGALSAQSCMLIAYQRGALAQTLNVRKPDRPGRMLAVGASSAAVRPMVKRLGSAQVVVACVNGPSLVTASGDERGISRLQAITEEANLMNRKLKVDIAYHSPHMDDISPEYLDSLSSISPLQTHDVEFHSSVRGRQVDTSLLGAQYWVDNMTSTVQFVDGVQSMYKDRSGPDALIEIGPHSTLETPIRDILKSEPNLAPKIQYFSALSRGQDATVTALDLAAALYVLGCQLDFNNVNHLGISQPQLLNDLPSYPWNHSKRHWHESRLSVNHRLRRFPRSDLLGHLVDDYNELEPRWRNVLRVSDIPWLSDHRVQGSTIFPLTGYLAMAIEAAFQYTTLVGTTVDHSCQYRMREINVSRSMVLSEDVATEVSLVLRPQQEGSHAVSKTWNHFSVFSWNPGGGWAAHCQGLISVTRGDQKPNPINGVRVASSRDNHHERRKEQFEQLCKIRLEPVDIYERFTRGGLEFGPAFRNIISALATRDHSIATVRIPDSANLMPFEFENMHIIHPGTFDACFQTTAFAASAGDLSGSDLHVPTFVKEINVYHGLPRTPGYNLTVRASAGKAFSDSDPDIRASFTVHGSEETHQPLIEVNGLLASKLPGQDVGNGVTGERGLCYKLEWQPCIDLLKPEQYSKVFAQLSAVHGTSTQIEKLDRAAFHHIRSTLGSVTSAEIDQLPEHLQKLHRVLTTVVKRSQQGMIRFQKPEWTECSEADEQEFLDLLESSDDSGRLVCRLGASLLSIFRGEIEPLSIMLQDNMLAPFYRGLELMSWGNKIAAEVIAGLAHQIPHMRIIELGAGTGGATMPILNGLGQNFASYDFTDISTGFFEAARAEQTQWGDRINYRKLDIEQDPVLQGFQPESYDLVIASNVLHATANMSKTMRHVRSLLRPGGKALIGEITTQMLFNVLIFGTLPGWWLGEELERQDRPFLTEPEWDRVLGQSGFGGLDSAVQINDEGPSLASVMIATAKPEQKTEPPELFLTSPSPQSRGTLTEHLRGRFAGKNSVEDIFEFDWEDKYAVAVALNDTTWLDLDAQGLERMQQIFRSARGILWVVRGASSQNPVANMVFGLARSMRPENAGLKFSTLDLDAETLLPDDEAAETIIRVAEIVFNVERPNFGPDVEFREIRGVLQVPRVVEEKAKDDYVVRETCPPMAEPQPFIQEGRPLKMALGQTGLLDTIHFVEDHSLTNSLADDEVELSVQAAGMNFKDIMISLGQLPFYHEVGIECSGIVTSIGSKVSDLRVGDRVCGMAKGAYATSVRVHSSMVTPIPQKMHFTAAASIPVVYCTAQYALFDAGRLSERESVLIHAAAGGVGQAAIMLAQTVGADLYVTVGSVEKRDLLMEQYGIAEDHIFSSRDTTFVKELMDKTNQRGVDVVLNSSAGDILHQSWQCLAPLGRFIEIGKRDIVQNSNLEMEKFADSVSFISVDLGVIMEAKPQLLKRLLTDTLSMYEQGKIRSVAPITVMPMSQLSEAMRMMQGGKHMGKVVIEARSDDIVQATPKPSPKAVPDANGSYLITGGTGGLGRSITRWLAGQGARHIILASRSGMQQKGVSELVAELKAIDVEVVVKQCNIADTSQVQNMIDDVNKTMPPIRGVIHGAMALRDALFDKISFEDWSLNIAPRVNGAWNLHNSLSSAKLDFFVILASACGITGNPGQTAYAASNTFLDSFTAYRQSLGLPASAIDIGIVEDVGYVAENTTRTEIQAAAHDRLAENELLALVGAAIKNPMSLEYKQTITGCKLDPNKALPLWANDPKFAHCLHAVQMQSQSSAGSSSHGPSARHLLKATSSLESAVEIIIQALIGKLSSLLMMPVEDIDRMKPIVAYGLDSLVAVEFRNWIALDLEANVPLMELMNSASIEALAGRVAEKSKLVAKEKEEEVDGEEEVNEKTVEEGKV
ncbi:MAG: hypothetical protein Q9194_003434 [Teloschistes cf. exilis]